MKYIDKLKDPRWQKKRLEVMQRDNFSCQDCCSDDKTLHVHHRVYLHGRDPWDYENHLLVTLCEECHRMEEVSKQETKDILYNAFAAAGLLNTHMVQLSELLWQLGIKDVFYPSVSAKIRLALTSAEVMELIETLRTAETPLFTDYDFLDHAKSNA